MPLKQATTVCSVLNLVQRKAVAAALHPEPSRRPMASLLATALGDFFATTLPTIPTIPRACLHHKPDHPSLGLGISSANPAQQPHSLPEAACTT